MELKDIVLSTLAEIDAEKEDVSGNDDYLEKESAKNLQDFLEDDNEHLTSSEEQFLKNLKERILVLFEGFKSPNNKNIEAKVDLTLNFLEYLLATIDERLKESADKKEG